MDKKSLSKVDYFDDEDKRHKEWAVKLVNDVIKELQIKKVIGKEYFIQSIKWIDFEQKIKAIINVKERLLEIEITRGTHLDSLKVSPRWIE